MKKQKHSYQLPVHRLPVHQLPVHRLHVAPVACSPLARSPVACFHRLPVHKVACCAGCLFTGCLLTVCLFTGCLITICLFNRYLLHDVMTPLFIAALFKCFEAELSAALRRLPCRQVLLSLVWNLLVETRVLLSLVPGTFRRPGRFN